MIAPQNTHVIKDRIRQQIESNNWFNIYNIYVGSKFYKILQTVQQNSHYLGDMIWGIRLIYDGITDDIVYKRIAI